MKSIVHLCIFPIYIQSFPADAHQSNSDRFCCSLQCASNSDPVERGYEVLTRRADAPRMGYLVEWQN